MKANIRQISEITGFALATVSNALNHKKGVNKETAEKILKTAEELGYRTGDKINRIRFVIFRRNGKIIDESHFHPAVIEGVERQAKAMGFETLFCYVDIEDPDYDIQLREILFDTQSAVILLGTEMLEEDYEPYTHGKNRIILLDGWSEEHFFDSVQIDNQDAEEKAVNYLIKKGHKKIGYLRGDFRMHSFRCREEGYRKAMARHGLSILPEYIVTVGTKLETAYEGMKARLSQSAELPTAFVSDNDVIAIGCMRALKEQGYDIPGDVSVIGFDNVAFGRACDPPLSTVHVDKQELGARAVREVVSAVENGQKVNVKIQLSTEFVERNSVKELRESGEDSGKTK